MSHTNSSSNVAGTVFGGNVGVPANPYLSESKAHYTQKQTNPTNQRLRYTDTFNQNDGVSGKGSTPKSTAQESFTGVAPKTPKSQFAKKASMDMWGTGYGMH
eukprot:m.25268 g.25268  ORF g.25268 m.25268 type:complete len:102 (-) comp14939_c0_seq1:190-495(-)